MEQKLPNTNIIINLNKPRDISSQQAVTRVKKLLGAKKAGHAGTLDPIATGVLIVCLDETTKIARFLSDQNKEYAVRLKLGERTDTYDSTGAVVERKEYGEITEGEVRRILPAFQGLIQQTPPMYSAIKMQGQTLYKLARKGITLEVPARTVTIESIDLISFEPPYLDLAVSCSKGTYIRSICDDIGNALGVGAHMTALERTRVGIFHLKDSVSFEDLTTPNFSFFSIDDAIPHLTECVLGPESYRRARNGVPVPVPADYPGKGASISIIFGRSDVLGASGQGEDYVRLKDPAHNLFGIGRIDGDMIKIERLLN
ncbi:MAG TPA: tRNA pseudouridine(55) synthase TruB [Thermodesulfovibrionales bacterium]|nr:tRNA pseudouridine(55) synthase TruB [Thermodesulfovibrionales bacterium]